MVAAGRYIVRLHGARAIEQLVAVAIFWLLPAPSLFAQPAELKEGIFITVNSPITSDVVNLIKSKTERAVQHPSRPARTVVLDFNPGGNPANTKEDGSCIQLADYLLELPNLFRNVSTVAFVHGAVSGHTVLPVLACEQIVMSHNATLGDVFRDQAGRTPRKYQTDFYEEVAKARGRFPAVVLKMLDKDLPLVERRAAGGRTFAVRGRKEDGRGAPPANEDLVMVGRSSYTADEAKKTFDLCNIILDTRGEVVQAYQLTPTSLREDPLEGREPIAERIVIREPVNAAMYEWLRRIVGQAVARHANLIILQLECSGGDTIKALELAKFFRNLKDDSGELPVMTIAYIPKSAPGAATFLALGCTEIVMEKGAEIGDFSDTVRDHGDKVNMLRDSLVGLAQEQGYPELVVQGMLDPQLTIYRVHSKKGQSDWRLIRAEDLELDKAGPQVWDDRSKSLVKEGGPGKLLKLDAQHAKELGIAREVVDNLQEFYDLYGIKHVRDTEYDFLYRLAAFLQRGEVAVFLIMIGIACLILELKMPGVGLPGVIAGICFVLYFWAQSQHLSGQIIMLAVLLFLLGLILIALEIFVLPGFGVAGVSGIVLVIVSLALVTLDKKPETTAEWWGLGRSVGGIGFGLVGAVFLASLAAWYLPSIPYVNKLVLKPPAGLALDTEGETLDGSTSEGPRADLVALLGAIGVAATTLRPAGIARFADDFIDVVSEGGFITAGQRVQVIEIEGNRVVVKEV